MQRLDGTSAEVQRLESQSDKVTANKYSVMLELQADCYAGIWAYHADRQRQMIEAGDIGEAMNAAAKIGDDACRNGHRGMLCLIPSRTAHPHNG